MRELSIEWALDKENRNRVQPALLRALSLIPSWVDSLFISFESEEKGGVVSIIFSHQYRTGRIIFYPAWFACSSRDQKQTLVHEMVHIYLSQMDEVFRDLVLSAVSDEALATWADRSWERAQEQAVSDLSFILNDLLGDAS